MPQARGGRGRGRGGRFRGMSAPGIHSFIQSLIHWYLHEKLSIGGPGGRFRGGARGGRGGFRGRGRGAYYGSYY